MTEENTREGQALPKERKTAKAAAPRGLFGSGRRRAGSSPPEKTLPGVNEPVEDVSTADMTDLDVLVV